MLKKRRHLYTMAIIINIIIINIFSRQHLEEAEQRQYIHKIQIGNSVEVAHAFRHKKKKKKKPLQNRT